MIETLFNTTGLALDVLAVVAPIKGLMSVRGTVLRAAIGDVSDPAARTLLDNTVKRLAANVEGEGLGASFKALSPEARTMAARSWLVKSVNAAAQKVGAKPLTALSLFNFGGPGIARLVEIQLSDATDSEKAAARREVLAQTLQQALLLGVNIGATHLVSEIAAGRGVSNELQSVLRKYSPFGSQAIALDEDGYGQRAAALNVDPRSVIVLDPVTGDLVVNQARFSELSLLDQQKAMTYQFALQRYYGLEESQRQTIRTQFDENPYFERSFLREHPEALSWSRDKRLARMIASASTGESGFGGLKDGLLTELGFFAPVTVDVNALLSGSQVPLSADYANESRLNQAEVILKDTGGKENAILAGSGLKVSMQASGGYRLVQDGPFGTAQFFAVLDRADLPNELRAALKSYARMRLTLKGLNLEQRLKLAEIFGRPAEDIETVKRLDAAGIVVSPSNGSSGWGIEEAQPSSLISALSTGDLSGEFTALLTTKLITILGDEYHPEVIADLRARASQNPKFRRLLYLFEGSARDEADARVQLATRFGVETIGRDGKVSLDEARMPTAQALDRALAELPTPREPGYRLIENGLQL